MTLSPVSPSGLAMYRFQPMLSAKSLHFDEYDRTIIGTLHTNARTAACNLKLITTSQEARNSTASPAYLKQRISLRGRSTC
jgi:hypothetical protein